MYLVVLGDGETFTSIANCKVVICPDSKMDMELSKEELAGLPFYDLGEVIDYFEDNDDLLRVDPPQVYPGKENQ